MSIMLEHLTPRTAEAGLDSGLDFSEAGDDGDAYLTAFTARKEAGDATPIDRANAAVETAEAALGIVTGDRDNVEAGLIRDAHLAFKRARAAAALAARFHLDGRDAAADRCADYAQGMAESIRAMDASKFDGFPVVGPFADGRRGRIARQGGKLN